MRDDSYAVDRVHCFDRERRDVPTLRWVVYTFGVETPHGIVWVQSYLTRGDTDQEDATYLRFVWRGRKHSRTLPRAIITERAAAIMAGRFVRDVADGRRT